MIGARGWVDARAAVGGRYSAAMIAHQAMLQAAEDTFDITITSGLWWFSDDYD